MVLLEAGRERVRGERDDVACKQQHLNHMKLGAAQHDRVIKDYQQKDHVSAARKDNRVVMRADMRAKRER
jgi:hypothetical protein